MTSKGSTTPLYDDDRKTSFSSLTTTSTGSRPRNLIIGATNRPFDVDAALLRRLTVSFQVPLPNFAQRVVILQNMLSMTTSSSSTNTNNLDDDDSWKQQVNFEQVAMATKGYSPSDLRHLLQAAVVNVMREEEVEDDGHHRPLTTLDVFRAMQSVPATPLSPQYQADMAQFTSRRGKNKIMGNEQQEQEEDDDDGDDDFSDYNPLQWQQRQQRNYDSSKWETEFGNFYSLGSLEVDPKTFEILTQLAREYNDNDSKRDNDDDDNNDDDDDEQDHHDGDDTTSNNNNNNSNFMDEWWSQERDRYTNDDSFQDLD